MKETHLLIDMIVMHGLTLSPYVNHLFIMVQIHFSRNRFVCAGFDGKL